MKFLKTVLIFFALSSMLGCAPGLKKSFSRLSKPEKKWVFFHPFKAKKAYAISREAELLKDSISSVNNIGTDNNGGRIDAIKHSYWMARLSQGIGKRAAYQLGKAHEKGNYLTYKKSKLEDGSLPDKVSSDMDLFNNSVGITLGVLDKRTSKSQTLNALLDSLKNGKLRIIKKDSLGNFLDCAGHKIPLDSLKGKWDLKKCIVPSY